MRKFIWVAVVALSVAFSATVFAADGAAIYGQQCAACHGMNGEGNPAMGPPIKGNKFITDGDDAAISDVITKGRMGDAKLYKNIALPMMAVPLSPDQTKAVIAHMKSLAK
jgi:mono/diheme cytochrome c family protein